MSGVVSANELLVSERLEVRGELVVKGELEAMGYRGNQATINELVVTKSMVVMGVASINEAVLNRATMNVLRVNGGYRDWETDRKSTRLNSSHSAKSRMPSSA